ncbi:M12 family metallopeptidase [Pendulispora rubella]|uniref:M12 family metallopeptidase n=1 Tax=Pendulispora rubella TaxID=2741070 RepID=A0ABZ2KPT0_9BACT
MGNTTSKICHDRVLPQELARPQRTLAVRSGSLRAVLEFRKLWVNGSTLRVRFLDGTESQRAIAREQAQWWTRHANLKFVFGNAPDAEIRISFDPSDGAWSWVGTDCKKIPQNEATMNLGFLDGGTAAHEFGHAIGLGHEHQNPAGGIEWNEDVVIRELGGPPNNWTPEQVHFNVLQKYATDQIRGTHFDPDSIMLYFFPASWTKNGVGTKANETLSALDKSFIASAAAYPTTSTQPTELQVNGPAKSASIGAPGEEDLYQFTAKKKGRYIIETAGPTDLVMKLFGPDSQTALITEDDDSGVGFNARIITTLARGRYFVQVRHFNEVGGTGAYSVKVAHS